MKRLIIITTLLLLTGCASVGQITPYSNYNHWGTFIVNKSINVEVKTRWDFYKSVIDTRTHRGMSPLIQYKVPSNGRYYYTVVILVEGKFYAEKKFSTKKYELSNNVLRKWVYTKLKEVSKKMTRKRHEKGEQLNELDEGNSKI